MTRLLKISLILEITVRISIFANLFRTYQFTNMVKEVVQPQSLDQIDPFLESNPPPQAEGV